MMFLMCCIVPASYLKAQYYPASIPHAVATNTKAVVNMGNDVINYTNNGVNETVKAIVYDGDTPGMFFEFLQAGSVVNSGVVSLNFNDVIDPDVALIAKNNAGTFCVYALVSYARPAGGIYLEIQSFDFSTYTFSLNQLLNIGSTSAALMRMATNVDSDQQDRFTVTWDELGGNGDVFVFGGYINAGGSFIFSPNAVAIPIPGYCGSTPPGLPQLQPFSQPDVAVFSAGSGGITNCIVSICHLDALGDLHVNVQRFPDIINGTVGGGWSLCVDALNGDVYNRPRIACQRYNSSVSLAQTGISMVYEINNPTNSTSNIGSTTSFIDVSLGSVFSFVNTYVLTDGTYDLFEPVSLNYSTTLSNISSSPNLNTNPVVSYNRKSGTFNLTDNTLLVGWNHNNGSTYLPLALNQFSTGIGCDLKISSFPTYAQDYQEVPFNPSGQEGIISISGEQTNNMLYSWYDIGIFDVLYKSRQYGLPLRIDQTIVSELGVDIKEDVLQLLYKGNLESSLADLRIYSVNGGIVYTGSLTIPSSVNLNHLIRTEGMYFLVLNSNQEQVTLKWTR